MTTTTIFTPATEEPNGTFTGNGGTLLGGGSIIDGDSATTGRTFSVSGNISTWVQLSQAQVDTIPAGQITEIRLVVDGTRLAGVSEFNLNLNGTLAEDSIDGDFRRSTMNFPTVQTAFTGHIIGRWVTQDGENFDQFNLAQLLFRMRLAGLDPNDVALGVGSNFTITEARIEVDTEPLPTLTLAAPAGSTSSNAPTATWSYSSTAFLPHVRSELVVVDSTTYDGAGIEVGNTGWVTTRFSAEAPLPKTLWSRWLKESYASATGGAKKKKPKQ